MTDPHLVYVGIGTNIDRARNVDQCLTALVERYGEVTCSSVYETESVGYQGDPYFNLAVSFRTPESPLELTSTLHQIEDRQGRVRGGDRFVDRPLDADLLIFDDLAGEVDGIELPRAEVTEFAHILMPLAEIAPRLFLPGTGNTMATLLSNFEHQHKVPLAVPVGWHGQRLPGTLSLSSPR